MKTFYRCILGLLGVLFLTPAARATHVRAGEITVRRTSSTALTYEVTLRLYCDISPAGRPATDATATSGVVFCFGDGNRTTPNVLPQRPAGGGPPIVNIGNETAVLTFVTTHTYNAPNTYTISVEVDNRNAGTLNIPGQSDQRSFAVETTLVINSSLGLNNTPLLLNPPVDFTACRGQRYIHNPNAFDPEGDSLAYRLTICKYLPLNAPDCNKPQPIPGFVQPDVVAACAGQNELSSGPATFAINSRTGDLVWDAPNCVGQVNVAFIVEEWRRNADGTFSKISETTRDMQIIIKDCSNKRPTIEIPPDVCVEAGQAVNFSVRATDPENNRLNLFSNSSLYGPPTNSPALIDPDYATFSTTTQPQAAPATGLFTWRTNCDHVRTAPYEVLFKVEDIPGNTNPRLVDSKIVRIRVVAPRPQNLRAVTNPAARSVTLTWNTYACAGSDVEIVVYRKEGCGGPLPDLCAATGIPPGYREVGRVPSSATRFEDTTSVRAGIQYSYVIQGFFNNTLVARSAYSAEACASQPRQLPLLTNVTVDQTSTTAGQITVKWTRPFGLNQAQVPGPYQYRLLRATGLNGTNYAEVTRLNNLTDTTFTDQNLNTEQNPYRYRLDFYYTQNGALTRLDTTESASSVRLSAAPAVRAVELNWVANTPWNNQNQRHRIYRQTSPGVFNRIAEVAVTDPTTFRYIDDGTDRFTADGNVSITPSNDSVYCYRVETVGTYGIPQFPYLLNNFSQVVCASPRDTTRPCPPALTLDLLDCATYVNGPCEEAPYQNTLTWTDPAQNPQGGTCDTRLAYYRIYYKRYSEDEAFTKIDSIPVGAVPPRTYLHDELSSYAGCYYVTAVNRSGVESRPSNTVCKDNCPNYLLPNVFTPNGDGKNDTFIPMNCPRFVKSVEFKVYNRWGGLVFECTDDIFLRWDGKTTNGKELAAGTYYYEARVVYERVSRADEQPVVLKGWVQLLR
jgi:gliding motility-associated-like protein